MFLWERFNTFGPKPVEFDDVEMEELAGDGVVRSVPNKLLKMTTHRWSKLKQRKKKSL